MATPPKVSKNPRYYSTGAKLDIRKTEDLYLKNHGMKKEDCIKAWKLEKAIRQSVKPLAVDVEILESLLVHTDNVVVQQINAWYQLHGVFKLSQLTYLRGLHAKLVVS